MKIVLLLLLCLTIIGCNTATIEEPMSVNSEIENNKEDANLDGVTVEKAEDIVPINPDDIPVTISILEPNSIGTIYMEATYTNNSEYPITGYSLTVLLKDKNEKTYLSTHDTVMPGETSPKFDSFGPATGKDEDYEILTLDLTARTEEGNKLYIEYDFKLGEATWWESENN